MPLYHTLPQTHTSKHTTTQRQTHWYIQTVIQTGMGEGGIRAHRGKNTHEQNHGKSNRHNQNQTHKHGERDKKKQRENTQN